MQDFSGRTAVVTGAASGIGRAYAERFAQLGMSVVLADIDEPALLAAEAELSAAGAKVLAVRTDVGKYEDLRSLRDAAYERFDEVHVLVNNAGVAPGGLTWEFSPASWRWAFDVNVLATAYAVELFVPAMIERRLGHVVNVASVLGLITAPGLGPYTASKHALVALSETLYRDLQAIDSTVGVTLVCPAWTRTRLWESERNAPPEVLAHPEADPQARAEALEIYQSLLESGQPPERVVDHTIEAVRENRFYVLTHSGADSAVREWAEAVSGGGFPAP